MYDARFQSAMIPTRLRYHMAFCHEHPKLAVLLGAARILSRDSKVCGSPFWGNRAFRPEWQRVDAFFLGKTATPREDRGDTALSVRNSLGVFARMADSLNRYSLLLMRRIATWRVIL
jgi:hypothetical protein